MQLRYLSMLLALLVVPSLGQAETGPRQAAPAEGRLELRVMVVAADLSVRPVPKRRFLIEQVREPAEPSVLTTDLSGKAMTTLPAGEYRLRVEEPLEFEGRSFRWDLPCEVTAGALMVVELSNDNATVTDLQREAPSAVTLDEGQIYRKLKAGVFTVFSEMGKGSGFLVDPRGLVLTNHHVVKESDYLAVKVDARRKYPAQVVASDPSNDLAVLRLNPEAVVGAPVLELAQDETEKPPVSVGERVLAIGSPLATETILTTGLVSKIEQGAIYSDVSINPGNSGGPLLNMVGQVVGVNTFGLPSHLGPGVSGIVRIYLARPLMQEAATKMAARPPASTRLAVESDYRFPPDELSRMALNRDLKLKDYHVESGKIDVQFMTPVNRAWLQVLAEREAAEGRKKRTKKKAGVKPYEPGTDFYEWRRYTGDYRPVVVIQAVPEIAMTGGSVFAVIMLGPNVPVRFKFKTDFKRMELYRGDTLVEPIWPLCVPSVVNTQQGTASMKDVAYYGAYEYPPEAFRPDAPITIKIWEGGREKPTVREVPTALVQRVYDDFKPYFGALEEEVAGPDN